MIFAYWLCLPHNGCELPVLACLGRQAKGPQAPCLHFAQAQVDC
jgi:hypothetical protein